MPSTTTKLLTGSILLLALYCGSDPLGHGPMVDFPRFQTYKVELTQMSRFQMPTTKRTYCRKRMRVCWAGYRDPRVLPSTRKAVGPTLGLLTAGFFSGMGRLGRTLHILPQIVGEGGYKVFRTGYAITSSDLPRSAICDPKPSPLEYLKNEHICGRPLGLRFHKKTGDLYIADAYLGLLKVGPEGGLATQLTTEAEGVPMNFTNDLDIDDDGNIYFTDSSTNFQRRNFVQLLLTADPSGRILKYNPVTKATTVLIRNIQFPNGISLSKDGSFFVFCESSRGRLSRYWLKGEKAGTSEVLVPLPGFPDNVRTNEKGEFWVAIHCRRTLFAEAMSLFPRLRKFTLSLPIKAKYHYLMQIGGKHRGIIIKYSEDGKLLKVLEDREGKVVRAVSEVEEKDDKLWIGSVLMPFLAVYKL